MMQIFGQQVHHNSAYVIPNMATETATNAEEYQMVTLKMRVRRISYIKVASATMNKPA